MPGHGRLVSPSASRKSRLVRPYRDCPLHLGQSSTGMSGWLLHSGLSRRPERPTISSLASSHCSVKPAAFFSVLVPSVRRFHNKHNRKFTAPCWGGGGMVSPGRGGFIELLCLTTGLQIQWDRCDTYLHSHLFASRGNGVISKSQTE